MMDKLLPCPFCGGEAKLKTARKSDGQISYDSIYVACLDCRSTGLSYTTYYNVSSNPEEEAIAAWNRRTGKDINVTTNNAVPVVRGYSYEDDKTYSGPGTSNYICSVCGEMQGTWKKGLTQNQKFKFCPWCGAKMDGGTDNG